MSDPYVREDEPRKLKAGDTWQWTVEFENYSPADGWSCAYRMIGANGVFATFTVITDPDNADGFKVTATAANTASVSAGSYQLYAYVSKSGERYTVRDGLPVTVEANPATQTATDTRSHTQKVLDAIKAAIEKRATYDQLEREVDGIKLKNRSYAELLKLLSVYEQRADVEIAHKRGKDWGFGVIRVKPRNV